MRNLRYLVVGGDQRYNYLAKEYLKDGRNIKVIFKDQLDEELSQIDSTFFWQESFIESDVIIFPLQIDKETSFLDYSTGKKIGLRECIDEISSEKIVLAGAVNEDTRELFRQKQIRLIDYFEREEMAILNSIPTVEGAIEVAMRELPITIYNSKCLVTGFGRIGKAMAKILYSLGAKVTVAARKKQDLATAKILGYSGADISDLKNIVRDSDIIFNTVPEQIINRDVLINISKESLIIDLASKPGGVDFEFARGSNIKVDWALALPGKVAPKTAGEMMKEVIDNILSEIYCL